MTVQHLDLSVPWIRPYGSLMWQRRHWQLALGCSLGLGGAGQFAVGLFCRSEFDVSIGEQLAGLAFVSASLVAAAAFFAMVTGRFLSRRGPRLFWIGVSAGFWSLLALVLTVGVVFRVASGSYLTVGVLMFTQNGKEAIVHAAKGPYFRWALAGVCAFVLFLSVGIGTLASAAKKPGRARRQDWLLAFVLLLGVCTVWSLRERTPFTRQMFVSGPLLALVSSVVPASAEADGRTAHSASSELKGPLRTEELGWGEAVEKARDGRCSAEACPRPNVLLFVLESIARGHLGAFGAERPTPAIDRLVAEGTLMTRVWTTATHSNYAQPAILSSLFPRRGRGLDQYKELDFPRFLYHDFFHRLGYDTATISSQDEDWQGMRRFQNTGTPTFYWHADDCGAAALDSGVERTAPDEVTTDQVLAWLARPRKQPFALYVNFQGTHFPYTLGPGVPRPYLPEEPDASNFSYLRYLESDREVVKNRYDNALAHVDRQIDRIRTALEKAGLFDDTLVVLTADHGEMFFDRGMVTHGRTLYDVESRVPLVLRWPGHVPAVRREEPVSHIDLMPTVAAWLGVPPHPSWQGQSFRETTPSGLQKAAIFLNIQGLRFADAIVCWPYKFMIDHTSKQEHLYQLANDSAETTDLLGAEPARASALGDILTMQMQAQLDYHRDEAQAERRERFAPGLASCPVFSER